MASRQREWQIRNIAKGLCKLCPSPRVTMSYCEKHRLARNASRRKNYQRQH